MKKKRKPRHARFSIRFAYYFLPPHPVTHTSSSLAVAPLCSLHIRHHRSSYIGEGSLTTYIILTPMPKKSQKWDSGNSVPSYVQILKLWYHYPNTTGEIINIDVDYNTKLPYKGTMKSETGPQERQALLKVGKYFPVGSLFFLSYSREEGIFKTSLKSDSEVKM